MAKVADEDVLRVKALGFLKNRGTEDEFSGRIITGNGVMTAAEMRRASQAAERFGNGTLCMTARLTIELPGIKYENIEPMREFLAQEGMETGGTGAKVRPVVSCKGTTCVFGNIDTQEMAQRIHDRFYVGYGNVKLPHKFKIAVGGCPNNCMKPDLNDVGIMGVKTPNYNPDQCRGCKKCGVETVCPMNAASVDGDVLQIDSLKCNSCGRCVEKCPFGAIDGGTVGCKVYIGGRWGKQVRIGTQLSRVFEPEEAMDLVEKCILLFKDQGHPKERFAETIDRLGMEKVEQLLYSNHLLERKEEILAK